MTETLWGVLIGGILGITGTLIAGRLATGDERRQRRRDHEIRQIDTAVRILDKWEELAMAILSGDTEKIAKRSAALRATDDHWDWYSGIIPGTAATQLFNLAHGVYVGMVVQRS